MAVWALDRHKNLTSYRHQNFNVVQTLYFCRPYLYQNPAKIQRWYDVEVRRRSDFTDLRRSDVVFRLATSLNESNKKSNVDPKAAVCWVST